MYIMITKDYHKLQKKQKKKNRERTPQTSKNSPRSHRGNPGTRYMYCWALTEQNYCMTEHMG